MFLADMHTHSDNSPDAENSVIEMCESAVAKGIGCFAVTDHCDIDLYRTEHTDIAMRQSYFDMLRARDVFAGQVEILRGMELGNALCDRELAQQAVGHYPYDLVLGSLHHPEGVEDFAFIHYDTVDVDALLTQYFRELEEMARWGGFDVLAHLTYPLRYINGEYGMNVDVTRYREDILRVFRVIVGRGIGLEVNTSGLRQRYGRTLPDVWCLKLYREAGGRIVTVGSDSHRASDLGANIADGLRVVREAGFREYCVYRNRRPVFIPLPKSLPGDTIISGTVATELT